MAEKSWVQQGPRPFFLQIYSLRGLPQAREWGLQFRAAALVGLALGIVTLVALLYLVQASQIATATYDIRQAEKQLTELERDSALLNYQIAQLSRPEYILEKALTVGFTTTLAIDYIPAAPAQVVIHPSSEAFPQGATPRLTQSQAPASAQEIWRLSGQVRRSAAGFLGWFGRRYLSATDALAKGS